MITAVPGVLVSFSDSCAIEFAKKVDKDNDGYITANGGAVLGPRHMFISTSSTPVIETSYSSGQKGKQKANSASDKVGTGKRSKRTVDTYSGGLVFRGVAQSFLLALPDDHDDVGSEYQEDSNNVIDNNHGSIDPDWSRVETLNDTLDILLDPSTLKKDKKRILGRQQIETDKKKANTQLTVTGAKRPRTVVTVEEDFSSDIEDDDNVSDMSEELEEQSNSSTVSSLSSERSRSSSSCSSSSSSTSPE